MLQVRRRALSAPTPRPVRTALAVASIASAFALGGTATATASTAGSAGHRSASCSAPSGVSSSPKNPFGANVTIFNPSESVATINAALAAAPSSTFPPPVVPREFFFMPGTYGSATATPATATTSNTIDAEVAPGTVIAGLGSSPCDVRINGALDITDDGLAIRPSQLENLTIKPIESGMPADTMQWFTSQEATWRRVNLLGSVNVDTATPITGPCTLASPCVGEGNGEGPPPADSGYAGVANGFEIANSNITGKVIDANGQNTKAGPGQEGNSDLYIQDSHIGGFTGFGTDMVFNGDTGKLPANDFGPAVGTKPAGDVDVIRNASVVRESPFVYYADGRFKVFDPSARFKVRGYDWSLDHTGVSLPLRRFHIANPTTDTAATLNAALAAHKDVLLTPGNYTLDRALTVPHADEVVFGLGESQLNASNTAAVVVKNAAAGAILAGFSVSGVDFDATSTGPFPADEIVIGTTPHASGSRQDPTTLSDVSTVSGATTDELIDQDDVVQNQSEIQTNNNGGNGYTLTNWPAQSSGDYGAVVNGNNVTWQGIWLEHFKRTEATWNGEGGNVAFLENELPLSVPFATNGVQSSIWKESATFDGYPSLAVSQKVTSFSLSGFQSWSRFGDGCFCEVTSLITAPVSRHVTLHDLFSGLILGTVPAGTTPSDDTVGGVLNMVNRDGVSALVPYDASWAGTSAFPYSDVYGHEVTARITNYRGVSHRRHQH